jgi:hypothetical protein
VHRVKLETTWSADASGSASLSPTSSDRTTRTPLRCTRSLDRRHATSLGSTAATSVTAGG